MAAAVIVTSTVYIPRSSPKLKLQEGWLWQRGALTINTSGIPLHLACLRPYMRGRLRTALFSALARRPRDLSEQSFRLDHRAMFAEANMRSCYFRYGYDIAIPLPATSAFHTISPTAPRDREYFATFKVRYSTFAPQTGQHKTKKQRVCYSQPLKSSTRGNMHGNQNQNNQNQTTSANIGGYMKLSETTPTKAFVSTRYHHLVTAR